jgi:hypothetical protein
MMLNQSNKMCKCNNRIFYYQPFKDAEFKILTAARIEGLWIYSILKYFHESMVHRDRQHVRD